LDIDMVGAFGWLARVDYVYSRHVILMHNSGLLLWET
jgi:hypothetical protein